MSDNHYDVIIIGTGAGGGTLAYRLAPSGKRILLLERGGYVPREKANWDSHAVVVEGRYHIKEPWRDKDGREFHAGAHYNVGGNTKFYGAALLRMRKEDFGQVRHHGGISPAWPIRYEDLEPYYTEAEHLYQVHGLRGSDPTEPPASAPYRHPPISHEPRIQAMFDGFVRQGHRPFPIPIGLMLDEQDPRTSRCIRCDTCDGFPCLVQAKADAQVICVDPALAQPNVTLVTDAFVSRLETSPSGREITLAYWHPGNFVGGPDVFNRGVHVWSGVAAINSSVLHLPGDVLREMVLKIPALAFGIIEGLSFKGRCYSSLAQMLGTRSPTERLAHLLLHLTELYGVGERGGTLIAASFTHADLSHMIGVTRQWVTNSLKRLSEMGVLDTRGTNILIKDRGPLRKMREGSSSRTNLRSRIGRNQSGRSEK